MYIWASIFVATMGLMTSICDIGPGPVFELMPEIPLEEEDLALGADNSSSTEYDLALGVDNSSSTEYDLALGADSSSSTEYDFQDKAIQNNDQDKTETKTRDDFSGAQKMADNSIRNGASSKTHFDPKPVPTLDSVDTFVPSSDGYYLRHKHLDTYVIIKVVRMSKEFVLPITSTKLYGQDLLWKHTNEEIIEEYIGVEFYPPIIEEFVGIFMMKRINGIQKRLVAFSYTSQGARFSYEPDRIYVEKYKFRLSSIYIDSAGFHPNNQ